MKKSIALALMIASTFPQLEASPFKRLETPKVSLSNAQVVKLNISKYSIPGGSFRCVDTIEIQLSDAEVKNIKTKYRKSWNKNTL